MKTNPVRGFASIVSVKVITLIIGIAITPILVRILGSRLYGDYAFILSILGITMILVNAGIYDGLRKYVAEEKEDVNWSDKVFGFYCRVGFFLAITAIIVIYLITVLGITERYLGTEFEIYFYILGIIILVNQITKIIRSALLGKGLEHLSEPLIVIQQLLFALFGLSLAYVGFNVAGLLIGKALGALIVIAVGGLLLSKYYDVLSPFRGAISDIPRRELLSFNFYSIILILLTASLYHVDILLLQPLIGSEETGWYKAALVVAQFLWFVPYAIQIVLLHSTSELWSRGDTDLVSEIASRVTRYTILFTILVLIGIASLADPFVPLYFGEEFSPAIIPLLLLLPGVLGFAIARPIFAIGQGKGTLRPLIIATGVAAIINLILNIILIPRFGMVGAAIATTIGYGSMLGFHIIAAIYIGYNPIKNLRLIRVGITALIAGSAIFGFAYMLGSSVYALVVVPPVGFIIYSAVALRTRAVDSEELIQIAAQLPEPIDAGGIRLIRLLN